MQRCMDVVLERRLQTWFVQEPSRAEEAVRDMARAAGMQHGKTEALIAFMRTQLEVDLTAVARAFAVRLGDMDAEGLAELRRRLAAQLGEGVNELNTWQLEYLVYILELERWPWRV